MRLRRPIVSVIAAAVFSAAFFVAAPALTAMDSEGDTNSDGGPPVADLQLEGLKRTKPVVIERLLSRYVAMSVADIEVEEIRTTLLDTGLFAKIDITIDYGDPLKPILRVSVEEKGSILPVPIFAATSEGLIGGFALIDANAFGLNDKAVAVGILQSEGWVSVFNYSKTPPDTASFGWMTSLAASMTETKIEDDQENTVLSYDGSSFDAGFELRRSLGPFFSASAGVGFRERAVADDEPKAARVLPISFGLSVRDTKWDGVFLSESSLSTKAAYSFGLIGDGYSSLEGRVVYERSLYPGLRAVIKADAFTAADSPIVFSEGPSAATAAILPSNFRSPSLAGLSVGLEARLFSFRAGTLSAFAAYQSAVAKGGPIGEVFAQGAALGARLYLAKIAIPAVDIGAAYNAETGIWRGAFGIGMRM